MTGALAELNRTRPVRAAVTIAIALLAVVAGAVASHVSPVLFVAFGVVPAAVLPMPASWPRATVVVVAPEPDPRPLPGARHPGSAGRGDWRILSEGLLVIVGLCLVVQAARRGTPELVVWASDHSPGTLVFVALAVRCRPCSTACQPFRRPPGSLHDRCSRPLHLGARLVGFGPRQAFVAIGALLRPGRGRCAGGGRAGAPPRRTSWACPALQGGFGELHRLARLLRRPGTRPPRLPCRRPFPSLCSARPGWEQREADGLRSPRRSSWFWPCGSHSRAAVGSGRLAASPWRACSSTAGR